MAYISTAEWLRYINRLAAINKKARDEMVAWIGKYGFADTAALVDYAYGLATKYGEGAGALAAEMYDATAQMQNAMVEPAVPAETASYGEVAKTVRGTSRTGNPELVGGAVGRLVKRTAARTTIQNAERDGAEWAWVPHGDTCPFCIMLASNGWQGQSAKARKGGHKEHIHANCDCEYAVRFDGQSGVRGYDPDKYLAMYENAEGSSWQEKLNAMRRDIYADRAEGINAQKRAAYQARNERLQGSGGRGIINTEIFHKSDLPDRPFNPVSDRRFEQLTIGVRKQGAIVIRGTDEVEHHLENHKASAATIGNVLLFRADACISEVIEEVYHFAQNMAGLNDDKEEPIRTILNEIEVREYMLSKATQLGIPRIECEHLRKQLNSYREQLKDWEEG